MRGALASLEAAATTFVVRGVTVGYAGTVDFCGGTAADLAEGREVEARGSRSADGTRLQVSRMICATDAGRVPAAPSFIVAGFELRSF